MLDTVIMLDPGHGGSDPGAIGPTGLKEKDITLAICKLLFQELSYFAIPILTRTRDLSMSLNERHLKANLEQANIFLSIHDNSHKNPTAHGIETFALKPGGEGEKIASEIQKRLIVATGLTDRGVKFANFHVLRETAMPAVLVELAFISNSSEEKLLATPQFQVLCAKEIARGLASYLGVLPRPNMEIGAVQAEIYINGQEYSGQLIKS